MTEVSLYLFALGWSKDKWSIPVASISYIVPKRLNMPRNPQSARARNDRQTFQPHNRPDRGRRPP